MLLNGKISAKEYVNYPLCKKEWEIRKHIYISTHSCKEKHRKDKSKQDWLSADSERKEGWQKVVIERAWDANDTSLNISF